jgi:hypothetical protein
MPDTADVLILQSHRRPLPGPWVSQCLASVQGWASARGYRYRFEDDALFSRLPADLREKTAAQPVIAADLARLAALDEALASGCAAAVWVDADTLIIDPDNFALPQESYAVGREVWIQRQHRRLRAFVKVHNAFLLFRPGNPFLAFYRHAAERLVRAHAAGLMAPQFIGPKLLTALHNLVGCPVAERAAMLSPEVTHDLLRGGGEALALFRGHSLEPPAAVNLCGSLVGREVAEQDVHAVIALLLERPELLYGGAYGGDG